MMLRATARIMEQLGATVTSLSPTEALVTSSGRLRAATDALDRGNSGTTIRSLDGTCWDPYRVGASFDW
jgi:5-enolpyruvylshikimate-3-phosphate synthase